MAALPVPSRVPLVGQSIVSCGRTSSFQRSCLRKLSASTAAPLPKPAVYLPLPAEAMRSLGLAPNVYEIMVKCQPAAPEPSLINENPETCLLRSVNFLASARTSSQVVGGVAIPAAFNIAIL